MSLITPDTSNLSRNELLQWYNSFLSLNYRKIEETASGAAHCQVFAYLADALYPGKIPLTKVNFNATQSYEFVQNYKILQNAFKKIGVDKLLTDQNIPVEALVQGRYQANLEFCQWVKTHFDRVTKESADFDASKRRRELKVSSDEIKLRITKPAVKPLTRKLSSRENILQTPSTPSGKTMSRIPSFQDQEKDKEISRLKARLDEERLKVADLQLQLTKTQQQRDFRFEKLKELYLYIDPILDEEEKKALEENVGGDKREVLELVQEIYRILHRPVAATEDSEAGI